MDLKQLKAVASELNEVLGLSPAIVTAGVKLPALQKKVEEAIALVDFEEDEFSVESMKAFAELGYDVDVPEEEETEEEETEEEETEEEETEEEETEEEETEEDLIALVEEADLEELKEIIQENDLFKTLRKGLSLQNNLQKLRTRALGALGVTAELVEKETTSKKAKKKETPVKAENKENKKATPRVTTLERVEFISPFIEEAKYTKKELTEMMLEEYPQCTKAAHQTILTDGKNPKYNKFPKLLVQDSDGIMSFEASKTKSKNKK